MRVQRTAWASRLVLTFVVPGGFLPVCFRGCEGPSDALLCLFILFSSYLSHLTLLPGPSVYLHLSSFKQTETPPLQPSYISYVSIYFSPDNTVFLPDSVTWPSKLS